MKSKIYLILSIVLVLFSMYVPFFIITFKYGYGVELKEIADPSTGVLFMIAYVGFNFFGGAILKNSWDYYLKENKKG